MLPDGPASYVLVLRLSQSAQVAIGRLGSFEFPSGWYAYAGSARGPGGLGARIRRHLRSPKLLHWHIDHLRAHAEPVEIWYTEGTRRYECDWARALTQLPGASVVASGFGASDCRCGTHLVRFAARPGIAAFSGRLGERVELEVLLSPSTDVVS
jgi:Uri superfamily endonuclease